MLFTPTFEKIAHLPQSFPERELKDETMLFSADLKFARKNGDGLTHLVLDNLPAGWEDSKLVIDSRVHMLMPGWYPAIPGWHHDDVARGKKVAQLNTASQPDYEHMPYYSEHLLFLVNAHIAPTEFITSPVELDIPTGHTPIYGVWNQQLNEIKGLKIEKVEDSTLYRFDWQTFHRGVAAQQSGWRYFIRISRYWKDKGFTIPDHERFQRRTNKNQIRRQVQVYMTPQQLERGW